MFIPNLYLGEPTDANIMDAILLGTKRIGHGYAIVKHPEVKKLARSKNIPLEICPISNQVFKIITVLLAGMSIMFVLCC